MRKLLKILQHFPQYKQLSTTKFVKNISVPNQKIVNVSESNILFNDDAIMDPLKHPDFFGVKKMVSVKDLFEARVHFGHKKGSRNEQMQEYLFGCRLDVDIFDLEKTLEHLHRALNFLAHIAYRNGIILFIMRSAEHGHNVEQAAVKCGEYSHTRPWSNGIFTNKETRFDPTLRLRFPDCCVFLSLHDTVKGEHPAIVESAKVLIPTVGVVDSNSSPSLITYPIPGNDDSLESIALYLKLFEQAILVGKAKRKQIETLKNKEKEKFDNQSSS